MASEDEPPSFWAFEVPPGGTLTQQLSADGCVCITGATLSSPGDANRSVLGATSGGFTAVLANLFGASGHDYARLGHPFSDDFTLTVQGTTSVHITGFSRGNIGPAESESRLYGELAKAPAKAKAAKAAPAKASGSIASQAKGKSSAAVMGLEDSGSDDDDESEGEGESGDGWEDGEDDYEGSSGDEEVGEEEEESESEEEDDDGDMPLAPSSVAAALGLKRPAPKAKAAPAKAAKADPKAAAKPAAKLAAKPAPAPAPAPVPAKAAPKKEANAMRKLPNGLELQDVSPGSGRAAMPGAKVNVKYYGTLTNGKKFDAGTISFRLGAGEVIKGWDVGVAGMKVGGKRKLRIPPGLGYGKRGAPPTIPGGATLLFDVELKGC